MERERAWATEEQQLDRLAVKVGNKFEVGVDQLDGHSHIQHGQTNNERIERKAPGSER